MARDASFFFADDPSPVVLEPDDPSPVVLEPDDPSPVVLEPDDPSPVVLEPDDPAVLYALNTLEEKLAQRSCAKKRRPPRCKKKSKPFRYQFSGNIVIRLSNGAVSRADGASEVSQDTDLGLHGLRRVLKRFELTAYRLVDLSESGHRDPKRGCSCGGTCSCNKCPTLYQLEQQAKSSHLPPLHTLAAYWRIDVRDQPKQTDAAEGESRINGWEPSYQQTVTKILRLLNELEEVDLAYRELEVTDPNLVDDNALSQVQEYLDSQPSGINARWARAQMEGEEFGVGLVDLEQGWLAHEDLSPEINAALQNPIFGSNRHGADLYRGHHGTAVLGQIGAADDDKGVVGIASAAQNVRVVSHYHQDQNKSLNVANAIRQAIPKMDPGDILLLEVQRSFLPTEVDAADRDAIRLAVAHGIVVIEAAGNGNADLDRYRDENDEYILNRRSRDYRDSGAIMVGAAQAARPHNRLWGRVGVGSNSGTRVDCFAHGNHVVTTGYGDLNEYLDSTGDEAADAHRAYTTRFAGTSSASPIIAGAALLVQSIHLSKAGSRLSPWEMRNLLSDPANGTRQGGTVPGRIGVMPDLRKLLRRRLGLVSDLYLRDRLSEPSGLSPRITSSPDIAVVGEAESAPSISEGYAGLGKCTPGLPHSVYVRMRNRGLGNGRGRTAVYWSEVATLITPSMWRPASAGGITPGTAATVPVGDQPVWSQAIPWQPPVAADGADSKHYCLMAMIEEPLKVSNDEPDPLSPPGSSTYFNWGEYRTFLRDHPNVSCRNHHLVEIDGDLDDDGAYVLPFLLTGTPDLARHFDFEVIRRTSDQVHLELEAPLVLASRFARRRLWKADPGGQDDTARLRLPSIPRLRVERVRLLAGAQFECRFLISGEQIADGHSLAIRQLYRGEEVGRITWQFGKGCS